MARAELAGQRDRLVAEIQGSQWAVFQEEVRNRTLVLRKLKFVDEEGGQPRGLCEFIGLSCPCCCVTP